MATCSSILAWEMPWTEEPGGLQSMGVINSHTALSTYTRILSNIFLLLVSSKKDPNRVNTVCLIIKSLKFIF